MLTVRKAIAVIFNALSLFILGIGRYYSALFTLEVIAISLGICTFLLLAGIAEMEEGMKRLYLRFLQLFLMIICVMFLLLALISPLKTILPLCTYVSTVALLLMALLSHSIKSNGPI